MTFCRDISNYESAEFFATNILEISEEEELESASGELSVAEMALLKIADSCTLNSENCRKNIFRSSNKRQALRQQIFQELIEYGRLEDDDDIKLKRGGARPKDGVSLRNEGIAYILIGPPASGKSGVSNKIADEIGAYIIDSDMAKRKLPEYTMPYIGAYIVHEESNRIISGGENFEVNYKNRIYNGILSYCIANYYIWLFLK